MRRILKRDGRGGGDRENKAIISIQQSHLYTFTGSQSFHSWRTRRPLHVCRGAETRTAPPPHFLALTTDVNCCNRGARGQRHRVDGGAAVGCLLIPRVSRLPSEKSLLPKVPGVAEVALLLPAPTPVTHHHRIYFCSRTRLMTASRFQ